MPVPPARPPAPPARRTPLLPVSSRARETHPRLCCGVLADMMRRLDVLSEQLGQKPAAAQQELVYDTLIRGGTVIDPANGLDSVRRDIGVKDGVIVAVEPPGGALATAKAAEEFDATGLVVTPGLVDLHTHGFQFFDDIGVNFDTACLGRCTTTAVDAGSSGASTFNGFKKYVIDQCKTRVLVLLNISMIGAGAPPLPDPGKGGSSDDLQPVCGPYQSEAFCSIPHTVQCIEKNRDTIVGIKIALSKSSAALFPGGPEKGEKHFYDAAREAARLAEVPLMCHHTFSTVPLEDCPGQLRAGDIYTHTLHGFESTIVQPLAESDTDRSSSAVGIHPAVHAAKRNGTVFDIGHGMGSFNWTVAEQCMKEGFGLDVISTDIWNGTCYGPCYDLPTVMTKCLRLGMSLYEVVKASTITPARTIKWDDRIGTLGVGRCADIAVMRLADCDMELEDCQSQLRRIRQRLVPVACWRAGSAVQEVTTAEHTSSFPNPDTIERQAEFWPLLHCRDAFPPAGASPDGPHSMQGRTRLGQSGAAGGAVRLSGASGSTVWQCLPTEQWPGGPAVRIDPAGMGGCCPPAAAPVIVFDRK